jgi:hypothetical protein
MVRSLLIGCMLGVLFRASAPSSRTPTIFGLPASNQQWFHDQQPWIGIQFARAACSSSTKSLTAEQWAIIGVTGIVWIVVLLLVGLSLVVRAEVKQRANGDARGDHSASRAL